MRKVLLVDDEPDIRRLTELTLTTLGDLEVCLAASGEEALRLAASEQPDVVLLDVMMPGLDGPATMALLRAQATTAAIPVILLTAKAQKHEIEAYLAMGACGVISKPFDPMALGDQIRRIAAPL